MLDRYSSAIRAACANERSCGSVRGAISDDRPYRDLVDQLVSEAGDSQWTLPRAAYEPTTALEMRLGNPNPAISGFPKPSPIRWSERVSAATSFYAAFRPLFRQVGRWCTGIPCGTSDAAAVRGDVGSDRATAGTDGIER